jgi:hypothetical protein
MKKAVKLKRREMKKRIKTLEKAYHDLLFQESNVKYRYITTLDMKRYRVSARIDRQRMNLADEEYMMTVKYSIAHKIAEGLLKEGLIDYHEEQPENEYSICGEIMVVMPMERREQNGGNNAD